VSRVLEKFEFVDGLGRDGNALTGGVFASHYSKNTLVLLAFSGTSAFPMAYIHKPKMISDADWQKVKDELKVRLQRMSPIEFGAFTYEEGES